MMRKIAVVAGAVGLLIGGAAARADDMAMAQAAQPAPAAHNPAAHTPSKAPAKPAAGHTQGMDHGGQQMHDQMMKDHQQGMAGMPATPPKDPAAAMPMQDCCMDKPMTPKDKSMAPKDPAKPMKPMKDM